MSTNKFEDQLSAISTCNIIDILKQTVSFIQNIYEYKTTTDYTQKTSFVTLKAKIGINSNYNLTNTKLLNLVNLNIDYNLLQSNMIGFSPANSNMWTIVTDSSTIAQMNDENDSYKGIYNDVTKYTVGDFVKFKDNFYECKNTDSNTGLFSFYTTINQAIEQGLTDNQPLINIISYLENFEGDIEYSDSTIKSVVDGLKERYKYLLSKNDSNGVSHKLPRCYDFIVKKLTQDFNYYRYYELKEDDTLNLAEKLREFSSNDTWKNNDDLWELVAAACNDIGSEFYSKIKKYISSLSDLDTCNLKALKSIAKSVNYSSEVLNISNNFTMPFELEKIVDLFTINRKILFDKQHGILADNSIADLIGIIDSGRSVNNNPLAINDNKQVCQRLPYNVIYKIKSNIAKINAVLGQNFGMIELYGSNVVNTTYWEINQDDTTFETATPWSNLLAYDVGDVVYSIVNKEKYYFTATKPSNLYYTFTNSKFVKADYEVLVGYVDLVNNKFYSVSAAAISSEIAVVTGKIYVDTTNSSKQYTFNGTNFVEVVRGYIDLDNNKFYSNSEKTTEVVGEYGKIYVDLASNNQNPISYINVVDQIKNVAFTNLSSYQKIDSNTSNCFVDLIHCLQQNMLVYNTDEQMWQMMNVVYTNEKTGAQENLLQLFISLIQSIKQYDLNYRYQFVMFHIFGLFYSKIFNYELDPSYNHPTQSISEYTIEEFTNACSEYIGQSDLDDYFSINSLTSVEGTTNEQYLIKNLTQNNLDFIKYTTFLFKNLTDSSTDFSSACYTHFYLLDSSKQLSIIQHMIKMSSYLTDYCIKVSYERELIKKQVKIYALAGTNQIIEDVLSDYFLMNFTRDDDNLFNGETNSKLQTKEQLTTNLSPFTIEFVEYQDNTNYFNIEADLPQVLTGQKITGYEKYIHESINKQGELVQEEQTKPIYENVYTNQSVSDANSQYWDSLTTLSNSSDIESYKDYYNQWLDVEQDIDTYLIDTVPFIEQLYTTFNPSGTNDDELDELLKFKTDTKINSNIRNHKNKTFPSIATLQFLPNLVEVSNVYKDDSMVLSKTIYDSTVQYLNAILTDIIKNSDYNRDDYYSVIKNGWKTDLAEFNGYTTYYEDSDNKDSLDLYSDNRIDVDGPWVYSSLQQFLYMYYNQLLSGLFDDDGVIQTHSTTYDYITAHNDYIDQFIDREFVYDKQLAADIQEDMRNIYKGYLFDYSKVSNLTTKTGYDEQIEDIFTNKLSLITELHDTSSSSIEKLKLYENGCILNLLKQCSIYHFEKDVYENQYTLFKLKNNKEFEDVGQIWMRMYNHPLSIPFEAFLRNTTVTDDITTIKSLANNCIEFKCSENTMMLLGYDGKSIKCAVFNFTADLDNVNINIDQNSICYISNDSSEKLPHINSYVGSYLDSNNNIHVVLYGYSLMDVEQAGNYTIDVYDHQYNVNKGYIDNTTPYMFNSTQKPILKEFLQNDSKIIPIIYKQYAKGIYTSEKSNTYHHIWNLKYNKNKDLLYVGFEFLNDGFVVRSDSTVVIDDSYEGYQKVLFNCPVLEYSVTYENEYISSTINGNIAKTFNVRLYDEQYEMYYKSDADGVTTPYILDDSIIQLKKQYNKQSRNTILTKDVVITPMWMLLSDSNIDISDKSSTKTTESTYMYNNYIQRDSDTSTTLSNLLYTKLINYFSNSAYLSNELATQIKNKLESCKTSNINLFSSSTNINLLTDGAYEITDTATYNNCVALFNDCMSCMNQSGLLKFNFTDDFKTDQISNLSIKSLIEQQNQEQLIDELDMDISVRVTDSNGNYVQNVGWKCNNTQSSNLNWLSSDNTSGGPEIVSFNLTSKIKNEGLTMKFISFTKNNKTDSLYNVVWSNNVVYINHNIGGSVIGVLYDNQNNQVFLGLNYIDENNISIDFTDVAFEGTYTLVLSKTTSTINSNSDVVSKVGNTLYINHNLNSRVLCVLRDSEYNQIVLGVNYIDDNQISVDCSNVDLNQFFISIVPAQSIQITTQDETNADQKYSVKWNGKIVTITHNYNNRIIGMVYDDNNQETSMGINYVDDNTITLDFTNINIETNKHYTLDIINESRYHTTKYPISAHWYNENASSTVSSLEIFYRGFYNKSQYAVLPFDNGCSINNILDVNIRYKGTSNNRMVFDNISVDVKNIYYGLLINWKSDNTADSIKLIYSSNSTFSNSFTNESEEYIYAGTFVQSNIISKYVDELLTPSTVNLLGGENSSLKYMGNYYYVSTGVWRCPNPVSSDNVDYYELTYAHPYWSLNAVKGTTKTSIAIEQYLVSAHLIKDVTIRQYIFDRMYASNIKVKLFDFLNKKIMLNEITGYNVYNVSKYGVLDNSFVDSEQYYVTLYDFINISNYSQFNKQNIQNIQF